MKKIGTILLCLCIIFAISSCGLIAYEPDEPQELTVEYVYLLAKENGYEGTLDEFIAEFKGEAGAAGDPGKDGLGIRSVTVNETGHLIIEYTNDKKVDVGLVIFTPDYDRITPSIGDNGNWYIGGNDTGVPSNASEGSEWYTGAALPDEELGFDGDFYISTSTLNVYYKDTVWGLVGSVKGSLGGGNGEMSQAAISRAMLSSVSVLGMTSSTNYQKGSGVIYSLDKSNGDAYIITNYHVIYNDNTHRVIPDSDMFIYLYGMNHSDMNYEIPVTYVGGSEFYDIAVLKVTGSELLKSSNARSAVVADSEDVALLDTVVAVGTPWNINISATKGSVTVDSEYLSTGERVMRIDAAVNPGNSGGGLYNINGELIGIVNAKVIDDEIDNIAYAIPTNVAIRLAENIIHYCDGKASESGKKIMVGVTVEMSDVTVEYDEISDSLVKTEEIYISAIDHGSLAEQYGLRVGDKILSITVGGFEYQINKIYHPSELSFLLRPGTQMLYKVDRGGTEMNITITLPQEQYFVNID